MNRFIVGWLAVFSYACVGPNTAPRPSNELLIVGYDREPDTLNRFSTPIRNRTPRKLARAWNARRHSGTRRLKFG